MPIHLPHRKRTPSSPTHSPTTGGQTPTSTDEKSPPPHQVSFSSTSHTLAASISASTNPGSKGGSAFSKSPTFAPSVLSGGHDGTWMLSPGTPGEGGAAKLPWWRRTLDGFQRDDSITISGRGGLKRRGADGRTYDAERAAQATSDAPLKRSLQGRHLQMIAFGGSIGTGLFIGSGKALQMGGPASLIISFSLIGIMLYCTMHSLGELAVAFPVSGSFSAYSTRFLDPAWGFAMGWNYALQWLTVLPLEIVAACLVITYWQPQVSMALWVSLVWLLVLGINLFGVKGFGEAEFVFSIIKVIGIVAWIIMGIILNIGGGPDGSYIGAKYYYDPGAFRNGFKGLCGVFVIAAFAFSGTELVGLAAAETANPRKTIPTAIRQVFWRITIFYLVSVVLVGLLVPYTATELLGNGTAADTHSSPFVLAIERAGIIGLPSAMNACIMMAVISVGNSAVYGASRTLAALAEQRQAPRIFGYIDREGRPLVALAITGALGALAFLATNLAALEAAFAWMIALSGLSSILTWLSICLAHIRFRRAWRVQGHSLSELAFVSRPGLVGSWLGVIFNVLVLAAQFWTGLDPVVNRSRLLSETPPALTPPDVTRNWFEVYLAAPLVLVCYVCYKAYFRTSVARARTMDLDTGRREWDGALVPRWAGSPGMARSPLFLRKSLRWFS